MKNKIKSKMEKKQSSVEWLNRWFIDNQEATYEEGEEALKQAKAMHKEEIIESYCQGCLDMTNDDTIFPRETTEQYYTKTFGGQDNE